ncbi:hypothetical protein ANCCAN_01900 [Ancylostoma caninum]|uniref:Uncharacterized protein n=1 Tax=Ancylostoma caninum TaxID=29170 RepID=A0A368H5C6_ANCCA|nr:hypothetical protein ANCCAN_01900 [Ancylostoma caninum]
MTKERKRLPEVHAQSSKPITDPNNNKNNTISSIRDMKNSGQLYSFILYTTSAESTPPRKTDDAITELGSIKAKPEEKKFKQLA